MENKEIILSVYEMTKSERGEFVTRLVEKLESGEVDPLKAHKQVKCMEDLIKQITSNDTYRQYLLDESAKYGKSFQLHGAEYQVKEAGTKYDYSQCNDLVLVELHKELEELTEIIKQRENFLKTLATDGMVVLHEETGEAYRIYPPAKSSTTTVTIKLP